MKIILYYIIFKFKKEKHYSFKNFSIKLRFFDKSVL